VYVDYKHRIFGLDVFRALAILLVLFSHSTLLLFPDEEGFVLQIIRFFGAIGVDLFFVLSGFLIGTIILKQIHSNKTSFKDFGYFWIRRWFRTLPNYFLILLINIILYFIFYKEVISGIGDYFFFLQNFSEGQPDFFTESWSLSIEEYAYIIGPLLLFLLILFFKNSSKNKLFIGSVITIILLITFLRFDFHLNNILISDHHWSHQLRKVVIFRIDSIYYGFIAAFISINYHAIWKQYKTWFFFLGMFLFFGMHFIIFWYDIKPTNAPLFYNVFYLPLVSISLMLLLPIFSNWKNARFLKREITHISILSYAVYLINYSIVLLTIQYFINLSDASILTKLGILIVYWFLSFYLAYLLYVFFERPITNLRDSNFIKRNFR
jgi:peptidoglycan/LPS O-acetylase OafA/YrhL